MQMTPKMIVLGPESQKGYPSPPFGVQESRAP